MNVEFLLATDVTGTLGTVARAGGPKDATAWQHQLQRAQAAGWFCRSDRLAGSEGTREQPMRQGPALRGGARQVDAGSRSALLRQPVVSLISRTAPNVPSVPGRAAMPAVVDQLGQMRLAADHQTAPGMTPGALPLDERVGSPAREAPDSAEPRPAFQTAAKDESPPVRVHIEDSSQGLRFWLGLDGTPAEVAARASGVAAELRRQCERAGLRLADVICNGTPVAGAVSVPLRSTEEP